MNLTRAVLRFAAPLPRLEDYQRFLFIGPHPDDIEIGAGASAAKLARAGKDICFLICADGRFGGGYVPELSPDELAAVRKEEAICSARALSVNDVRFLGLSDGGFYAMEDLLRGMAQVIGDFQPQVIFAPDPCVTSECHIDHLNVGNAARRLSCFAPYRGIMAQYGAKEAPVQALAYYMTAKPNRYIKTSGYLTTQLSAIFDFHKSQFPNYSPEAKAISTYLKLRAYDFGLRSLSGCAEGFRVLSPTHMHCLPEAGD